MKLLAELDKMCEAFRTHPQYGGQLNSIFPSLKDNFDCNFILDGAAIQVWLEAGHSAGELVELIRSILERNLRLEKVITNAHSFFGTAINNHARKALDGGTSRRSNRNRRGRNTKQVEGRNKLELAQAPVPTLNPVYSANPVAVVSMWDCVQSVAHQHVAAMIAVGDTAGVERTGAVAAGFLDFCQSAIQVVSTSPAYQAGASTACQLTALYGALHPVVHSEFLRHQALRDAVTRLCISSSRRA
jgi:hypothetical protein